MLLLPVRELLLLLPGEEVPHQPGEEVLLLPVRELLLPVGELLLLLSGEEVPH